jgi:hypothetical protein
VTLTSSVSTSYLWSNGATTQSITVNSAGDYSVRVTDANGCQSLTSAVTSVTVNPLPSAPVVGTITQPTCSVSTGSVALSGLPATGTWTLTRTPGGATQTGTGATYTTRCPDRPCDGHGYSADLCRNYGQCRDQRVTPYRYLDPHTKPGREHSYGHRNNLHALRHPGRHLHLYCNQCLRVRVAGIGFNHSQ